jgi:hypothetical protein
MPVSITGSILFPSLMLCMVIILNNVDLYLLSVVLDEKRSTPRLARIKHQQEQVRDFTCAESSAPATCFWCLTLLFENESG